MKVTMLLADSAQAVGGKLEADPHRFKRLAAPLAGYRRLREGDKRVGYKIVDQEQLVVVLAVGPRRDDEVYALIAKRVS